MNKIDFKRKLCSRKFWACVCDFVGMLLVALHVAETDATQIVALVMAGAGMVAYIIGEGLTDAAAMAYEDMPEEEIKPPESDATNEH